MNLRVGVLTAALLIGGVFTLPGAVIIDKTPDQGPYWHPLGGSSNGTPGTDVYADSFVFSGINGTLARSLGLYLQIWEGPGAGPQFRLQLWGDSSNAPNPGNVLATTGILQTANTSLQLVTGTLLTPYSLTSGARYWVAATVVGLPVGLSSYQMGGHTQNSIYLDDGTFWYSNDVNGIDFDGQGSTLEMAIYVGDAPAGVPEPGTLALLGAGLGALALARRRK